MTRLFAALYASEPMYGYWDRTGILWAKARAVVLYDRILTGQEHRIMLNGRPLNEIICEAGK